MKLKGYLVVEKGNEEQEQMWPETVGQGEVRTRTGWPVYDTKEQADEVVWYAKAAGVETEIKEVTISWN